MKALQTCCVVFGLLLAGIALAADAQTSVGSSIVQKIALSRTSVPGSGSYNAYSGPFLPVIHRDADVATARRIAALNSVPSGVNALAVPANLSIPFPQPNSVVKSSPSVAFEGLTTEDTGFTNGFVTTPPDQGLCVGHGYVLEIINSAMTVFSTSGGALTTPISIYPFFDLDSSTNFLADPRCYYDAPTQRWFASVTNVFNQVTGRSDLVLAVSQTSDPRGAWYIYSIDSTDDGANGTPSNPNCPCDGDQPLLGADSYGVYISSNEFPLFVPGFNGSQIYALSKLGLEAGEGVSVVHFYNLPLAEGMAYSVQPASSPDLSNESAPGTEYFMSALDFLGALDNRIAVWAMTNTSSLGSALPSVGLTNTVINSEVYGIPPNVTQKAGSYPLGQFLGYPEETIDTDDDRMQNAVYASDHLWAGLTTVVTDGVKLNAGVAYFDVKPSMSHGVLTAAVQGQGYISVKGNSAIYPGIGVTADGTAAAAFTVAGDSYYPSAAYAHITPGGSQAVNIVAAGAAPQDDYSGYPLFGGDGAARWGDYSWGVADGNSLWLGTEYIPGNIPSLEFFSNFGTYLYKVNF
jgi:hypothetical protein